VDAWQLEHGHRLVGHDGQHVTVEEAYDTGETETVCNLRIADYHTYFVGDPEWGWAAWAHNACTSSINRDPGLIKQAQAAGRTHQRSIDALTHQLGQGNFNPGIGTKGVFGNVLEARARDGARVYFRMAQVAGDAEILAKSTKANQGAVIGILRRLYGG
jgi:hypothetical protein